MPHSTVTSTSNSDDIRVLYLVINRGTGQGGHMHSLKYTAQTIGKLIQAKILNIGPALSPVHDSPNLDVDLVPHRGIVRTSISLIRHVYEFKPSIIHTFDQSASFYGRIISILCRVPLIHTKCGGPTPVRYAPHLNDIILYSREDQDFFASQPKFAHTRFHLIPNRVSKPKQASKCIAQAKKTFKIEGTNIFLRISRINRFYSHSIDQSINLVNRLNSDHHNASLVIIGTIQDRSYYNELISRTSERILVVTDQAFTLNAAAFIDIADYVIGTGRGFMEAATLGKIMLAPCRDLEVPMLVDPDNVNLIQRTNFSERYVSKSTTDKSYREIVLALEDQQRATYLKQFTSEYARKHFDIEDALKPHLHAYRTGTHYKLKPNRFFDILLHAYLTRKIRRHSQRKL